MDYPNRREFLHKSASVTAGLAAAGLIPRRIFGEESTGFNRIVYRMLGSTGYKVSEVGFGAMNMRNPELVHAAIDNGINYIDTAHGYMRGRNEEVIGEVMKTKRDMVFLTTKVHENNPDEMMKMMETSLKRLQTDHVDLFLLHGAGKRESILNEDTMKVFDTARKKGMTRFAGISTHATREDVLDSIMESKFWEAVLITYNYMSPQSVTASIKKIREAGIAVIGMKNMLSPASYPWQPLADMRKDKTGEMTAAQALIKWVLNDTYMDTTIPGITSFEQLQDDIDLMTMKMTYDDHRTLLRYGERIRGYYCHGVSGCTGCVDQCPKGVCIRDINRCLSYANSYGDLNLAWENYRQLPKSSRVDTCGDCDECVVKCLNGLNLTENINKAKELFA
ncbi:aldo/keto reductase [Candidatus Latescibacterota bacterium]